MIKTTVGIVAILLLTGCASLISSATTRMADNITLAILNQNDLETVRLGAPAYLLMLDGLIEGDAENTDLLLAGAKLYSSYTSAFIDDEDRAKRLAEKSFGYARTALCIEVPNLCQALPAKLKEFEGLLNDTNINDLPTLYGFATAWASWIQVNADDWNALTDLPKLTVLFEQVVRIRFDPALGQFDSTTRKGCQHIARADLILGDHYPGPVSCIDTCHRHDTHA